MLDRSRTVMVLVDVQGKLARIMHDSAALAASLEKLVRGMNALKIPVIWVEQNPAGLGPTIPELSALLQGNKPLIKTAFGCCDDAAFMAALKACERKQVVLAGIEAHVCVFQTGVRLIESGYEVHLVSDGVSSRTGQNRRIGIERIRAAGATVTSVEMCLFELLHTSADPVFKDILNIVK